MKARTIAALLGLSTCAVFGSVLLTVILPHGATVTGAEVPIVTLRSASSVEHRNVLPTDAQAFFSVAEIEGAVPDRRAVIVIEPEVAADLGNGSLREFAEAGSAVIAINTPLSKLHDITGFRDQLSAINPGLGDAPIPETTFRGDYFSVVWHSPVGPGPRYASRGHQDMHPGLFAAVISDFRLRVRGQISDEGNIVPLEDYGQE